MLHSHDQFSHLTQNLTPLRPENVLKCCILGNVGAVGGSGERMGWENRRREGEHRLGYVFGMATTVFHPLTHLVHVSIHFRDNSYYTK